MNSTITYPQNVYCRKHGISKPNETGPACPKCAANIQPAHNYREYRIGERVVVRDVACGKKDVLGIAEIASPRMASFSDGVGLYLIAWVRDDGAVDQNRYYPVAEEPL